MNELTLHDIRLFHADLITVRSAGVKLDMNSRRDATSGINCETVGSLQSSLQAIETGIAAETSRGRKVEELLQGHPSISAEYLAALRTWLYTEHSPISFEPMVVVSEEKQRKLNSHRTSAIQPILWLVVSYLALVLICLLPATNFLNLSENLRAEPGPMLSIVILIRSWIPIWSWLVPLLLAVGVGLLWKHEVKAKTFSAKRSSFPGTAETVRRAALAAHTARLIQQGLTVRQATELLEDSRSRLDGSELPPLLQWASGEHPTPPTGNAAFRMQLTAHAYRGIAASSTLEQHENPKMRVVYVLLGGVLVLGVALCVFGPLVELLYFVANSYGSES